ncbi:MAG TPA: EpsI family protein [Bryobacteraceae bacterium]|nr:EpsI family protein [Bryobacteraceae bacterium]
MRNKFGMALAVALVAQTVLFYSASRRENTPLATPLSLFPTTFGNWTLASEGVVEKEELDVLRADDVLTRVYKDTAKPGLASIFIAYFKSQRTGQSPHSPKNCLPGSGWQPEENDRIDIPVSTGTIHVNRYLVSKGADKSLVLYWYQSQGRTIASEFAAKFYLVADSIRHHRSDAALVRVIVPVPQDREKTADALGIDFVQSVFPVIKAYLPE